MTYKTLLVHAEPDWGSAEALEAALHVSRLFGAHIVGVGAEAFELANAAFVDGELVQALRDEVDLDLTTAQKRFAAATAGLPHGATFHSGVERPCVLMGRHARGADLVIARRTPADASVGNLCHPADLIMETGLPVLLVPRGGRPLGAARVVVAWKDHKEARRALTDALPFLARAEQVVLAAVCDKADVASERVRLREVVERLGRLGVQAQVEVHAARAGSPLPQIEETCDRVGADLLVAGAYSHSRVRQWALGGVTQDLLAGGGRHVLFSR